MSFVCSAKHDTHCHLLLGLSCLDLSEQSRIQCAQEALNATEHGMGLPSVLSPKDLHSEALRQRVMSFVESDVECFEFYSTCYKDAKACYEVILAYADEFAASNKTVHLGLGLHPFNVTKDYRIELKALASLLENIQSNHPQLTSSLGEIGLDKRIEVEMELQCECVRDFIEMTIGLNKPYSFHCVRAFNELDRLISSFGKDKVKAIIHGFNGSTGIAKAFLAKGYSLGIGSAILSPQNETKFTSIISHAHDLATATLPLLETDYDGSNEQGYDASVIERVWQRFSELSQTDAKISGR